MFTDSASLSRFLELQKFLKPNISVEVGAFDADFSQFMAQQIGVDCFAFEASPYVYEKFKEVLKDINYINMAVSNHEGKSDFQIQMEFDPANVGHNSIKKRNEEKQYRYIDVDSTSLDLFFKEKFDNNFCLWIDCEGASREVLEGGRNLLESVTSIYIETETENYWNESWLESDVEEFLNKRDFELIHKSFAYIGQNNCIFVKRNYVTPEIRSL